MNEIKEGLRMLARAKAIEDAIKYHSYLAKNFNIVIRKNPKDIIETAKIFVEFIEEK